MLINLSRGEKPLSRFTIWTTLITFIVVNIIGYSFYCYGQRYAFIELDLQEGSSFMESIMNFLVPEVHAAESVGDQVNSYYGSFSTEIPIAVPVYHGLEPKLKLIYNSSGGNSMVGVGWGLTGTSSIMRSIPGGGAPKYDDNDVYFMDGMELIPCTSQGGTHCTKIQNYTRIVQDTANNKWYMWGTNGNKVTFEPIYNTSEGTYQWMISQLEDPNGNIVTYNYWLDKDLEDNIEGCYLDNISYNQTVITFHREERPDPILYANGVDIRRMQYRIKTIDVQTSGSRVRSYKLTYSISNNTSRSILTKVEQFGNDAILDSTGTITGGTSLPGMTMVWQESEDGFTQDQISLNLSFNRARAQVQGDFNGDGKTDFLLCDTNGKGNIINPNSRTFIYLSNADGTFIQSNYHLNLNLDSSKVHLQGDFNHDGKTDFMICNTNDYGKIINANTDTYIYISNGDGTFTQQQYSLNIGFNGAKVITKGDFNGDGNTDFLLCDTEETGRIVNSNTRSYIYMSNGDSTFTQSQYPLDLDFNGADAQVTGDFNGDGKTDFLLCDENDTDRIVNPNTRTFLYISNGDGTFTKSPYSLNIDFNGARAQVQGDFNGDGKTDFLLTDATGDGGRIINPTARSYVYLSTGHGFIQSFYPLNLDFNGAIAQVIGDLNSDGVTDFLLCDANDTNRIVNPETRSFLFISNRDGTFTQSLYPLDLSFNGARVFVQGDFDGNNKPDFLLCDADDKGRINNPNSRVYTYHSKPIKPDLLSSYSNGIGGTTSIEYIPSTEWVNTYMPEGLILQTITTLTTDDGRGNISTMDFQYAGGLWLNSERRFLGFRKVTSVIDAQGNYKETYYLQQVGSIKKPEYTYMKDNQGNILSYTKFVYTYNELPPYTSFLTERWDYICNQTENCQRSLIQLAYDEYSNVIASWEYGDYDLEGDERTTIRGYYPNTNEYITGLPTYENLYEGIGTQGQLLKRQQFYYDGNTSYEEEPTKGNLTKVEKWNDQTGGYVSIRSEYDQYGNLIKEIDERSYEQTIIYDSTYHIYEIEKRIPLGHVRKKSWDMIMGLTTSFTNENNQTVYYDYDTFGRMIQKTDIGGTQTQYQYLDTGDPNFQRIRQSMIDGSSDGIWEETYQDGLGRHYKTISKGGFTKDIEYIETTSRILRKSLVYGPGDTPQWIEYAYDGAGRMRMAINPDGSFKEVVYGIDNEGKPYTAEYDELRHEKVTWKDAYGNTTQIREKNSGDYYYTNYEYSLLGKLIRTLDAVGNISTFTFDSFGRKIDSCSPDLGCWSYTFDDAGNVLTQTDAKAQIITYTYDELGRRKTKTLPNNEQVQFFYDEPGYGFSVGKLTRVLSPSGSETHSYDERGFDVSMTKCIDGTCQTIEQAYDQLGRISSVTYPDNEIVTYSYNESGRLNSVSGYVNEMIYHADGRLQSIVYTNNTRADYTYSESRRWLTTSSVTGPSGLLYDAAYTYGASALVTSASSTTDLLMNVNYTYDDLNRLTGLSGNQTQQFSYDPVGNRIYTHNENPVDTGINSASFTYDENGNMISDGDRTFTWNYDHQLSSVNKAGQTTTFVYDSYGNRIQKTGLQGTIKYFGKLAETENGSLVKYYYAGPILVAKQDTSGKYWYHTDRLGSIKLMTDVNGQKVNEYTFASFGRTANETVTATNERGFTGHINDSATGLIYMAARYYDPLIGRFISPDTVISALSNPQSLNSYSYCLNNPISNIDPTGHISVSAILLIVAEIATVMTAVAPYLAVAGLAMTVAGYFTNCPELMTFGSILLGFASGYLSGGLTPLAMLGKGLLGAVIAYATSPMSPLDPVLKQAIGWAWTAYCVVSAWQNATAKMDKIYQNAKIPAEKAKMVEDAVGKTVDDMLAGAKNVDSITGVYKTLESYGCPREYLDQIQAALVETTSVTKEGTIGGELINIKNMIAEKHFLGKLSTCYGAMVEKNGGSFWNAVIQNPTGGLTGPGAGWLKDFSLVAKAEGWLGLHACNHDAIGFINRSAFFGYGNYISLTTPGILASPIGGQAGGISYQYLSNGGCADGMFQNIQNGRNN